MFIEVQTGTYFGEDDIIQSLMITIEHNEKKLIIVSGYFNPLHKGHVEYSTQQKFWR